MVVLAAVLKSISLCVWSVAVPSKSLFMNNFTVAPCFVATVLYQFPTAKLLVD